MADAGGGDDLWVAAADITDRPDVTRSTMMGLPCLRVNGSFFASLDRATGNLVVKLNKERVDELIGADLGEPFAPAGRRFREWVAVPALGSLAWPALLEEALAHVRSMAMPPGPSGA